MVLACLVRQAIDELFGQTPRLQLITLHSGTLVGTTAPRLTTARAIVITLVRRRTSRRW